MKTPRSQKKDWQQNAVSLFSMSLSERHLEIQEFDNQQEYGHAEGCYALGLSQTLFLFMCYTGLRYSGVANLKRCDIQENRIEIVTEKTNVVLNIDLNTHSRRILQKYERYRFKKDAALPMISNQKMNQKYEVIGTHTGRRSFICNAISMGIPPQ